MKNKIFLIFAFNLFFNFGICEEKIPLDNLNMRRIRGSLSAQAKELQRILDDPQINKIDDEKLLLGGILDELLRIDRKYEDLYRDKATPKVLEIYQRVREGKEDFRQHRGIFEGRQGLINAAIMARDAIKRLLGLYTVEGKYDPEFLKRIPKSWERWLQGEDVKLKTAYILLGVNNIIREALSPELYVASQPDKPHYFHEVDIFNQIMWNTPEGERIAYEMIEHFLEDHSEFPLDTAPFSVIDWTEWCRRFNLYNMLINKFQGSAIKMLKYRYPEKFYPNEGHIWHDWDFRVGRWTPELIIQAIKHNIEDPIHGEGWDVNVKSKEFVNNVNSWKEWFTSRGLRGLLQSQFGDSPVEAFKFVYPDKFDTGLWKESDFETKAGKGPAKLFHTPVKLEKPCRKGFGYVRYNFGVDYEGFWVNKLNDYYGGLWKEEDGKLVLLYVFSLIKHPGPEILILTKGETLSLFQPVPNKLKNIFDRLARKVDSAYELFPEDEIKEKMRVLADLGITEPMRQLSLSEQTALLDFLIQTDGLEILQRYLNYFSPQNKLSALKVLASQADPRESVRLIGAFPGWEEVFLKYAEMDRLAKEASKVLGTGAMRLKGRQHKYKTLREEEKIDPARIREFKAEALELLETGVVDAFEKANAQIMELLVKHKDNRQMRNRVLALQEKLKRVAQMLFDFSQGRLEFVREEAGGSIVWFRKDGHQIRLILRPQETDVQASIRFAIDPVGMNALAGFRIDRVYDPKLRRHNLTIDIDLGEEFSNFYEHHYPLKTSHQLYIAEEKLFSWLVRMVW